MSAFGGKADIVRPPRGGLSVSCNWQIGAQGTSRKCRLPKIDVRAAHNGPHGFYAISIDRLIQPLVIQATAHRKKYLAELASMWGYFVLLKGRPFRAIPRPASDDWVGCSAAIRHSAGDRYPARCRCLIA